VEPPVKEPRSRTLCTAFAALGFVLLIVGVTYFGALVLTVHYGPQGQRAAAYYELGQFLTGNLEWYKDARIYGAASLVCALTSLLFGVSPLARITIPIAGGCYVVLVFYGDRIAKLIESWARSG
jgi:hypothetical protein